MNPRNIVNIKKLEPTTQLATHTWQVDAPSQVDALISSNRYNLRPQRNDPFKVWDPLSRGSIARGRKEKPPYGLCGKLHLGRCRMGTNICYKCGQEGHFKRDYPKRANKVQPSTSTPPIRGNQGSATSGSSEARPVMCRGSCPYQRNTLGCFDKYNLSLHLPLVLSMREKLMNPRI